MEWLTDPQAWVAVAMLTALEIVLGIDNIIFISILVGRLPYAQRNKARVIGLVLAMGTRILLLMSLAWIMTLTAPLFAVLEQDISGRDLILVGGGLFLLWKSVFEIHNALEGTQDEHASAVTATFGVILIQIAAMDIIFSLDSVITAVGLVEELAVMIIAIVAAVAMIIFAAKPIGDFVDRHPTIKLLALSFLIVVGVTLIADGFEFHVPRGYIYFAMAFSVTVEMLNLRMRARIAERGEPHLRPRRSIEEKPNRQAETQRRA